MCTFKMGFNSLWQRRDEGQWSVRTGHVIIVRCYYYFDKDGVRFVVRRRLESQWQEGMKNCGAATSQLGRRRPEYSDTVHVFV